MHEYIYHPPILLRCITSGNVHAILCIPHVKELVYELNRSININYNYKVVFIIGRRWLSIESTTTLKIQNLNAALEQIILNLVWSKNLYDGIVS